MQIIEFITNWVLYPLVVWTCLGYAKKSATHPLNKTEKFTYVLSIISILISGVN